MLPNLINRPIITFKQRFFSTTTAYIAEIWLRQQRSRSDNIFNPTPKMDPCYKNVYKAFQFITLPLLVLQSKQYCSKNHEIPGKVGAQLILFISYCTKVGTVRLFLAV